MILYFILCLYLHSLKRYLKTQIHTTPRAQKRKRGGGGQRENNLEIKELKRLSRGEGCRSVGKKNVMTIFSYIFHVDNGKQSFSNSYYLGASWGPPPPSFLHT